MTYRNEKNENEAEEYDTVGMIFSEEVKRHTPKPDITPDKIQISKDPYFRKGEYNSLSEIFADRVDFDMSTIKEMVESLEEESLHFRINPNNDLQKPKSSIRLTPRDDQSQNSFEKIIKYMKSEISKIDAVKKHEKDSQKVAKLMKDFIHNLKHIELSPRVLDEDKPIDRSSQPLPNPYNTPELKTAPPRAQTTMSNKAASTRKLENKFIEHPNSMASPEAEQEGRLSEQESFGKDEENINKDYAEPVPNKLPPMSTFTSKHYSPDSDIPDQFFNDKMSDIFTEFVKMKNFKMSHNTPEHLPNSPYTEENKGFYKNYMSSYQSSTLVKDKTKKTISKCTVT
jgi:hypothetical protein